MVSTALKYWHGAIATVAFAIHFVVSDYQALANSSIRLVVPYPNGGFADRLARGLAMPLAPRLGAEIYVEVITGAGGLRGAIEVARAPPDGKTLLVISPPNITIATILNPTFRIDPVASFTPIAHIGGPPFVLVSSRPRSPPRHLSDLQQTPVPATYGSPGFGTIGHILCAAIAQRASLALLHVPYSKSMLPDLLGGHLDLGCISLSTIANSIADGRLFPLVVTGTHRRRDLPDVPVLAELEQNQIPGIAWLAVVGPAGLPPGTTSRLNTAIVAVLASHGLAEMLRSELAEALPISPRDLGRLMQDEVVRWPPIIESLKLRP